MASPLLRMCREDLVRSGVLIVGFWMARALSYVFLCSPSFEGGVWGRGNRGSSVAVSGFLCHVMALGVGVV